MSFIARAFTLPGAGAGVPPPPSAPSTALPQVAELTTPPPAPTAPSPPPTAPPTFTPEIAPGARARATIGAYTPTMLGAAAAPGQRAVASLTPGIQRPSKTMLG